MTKLLSIITSVFFLAMVSSAVAADSEDVEEFEKRIRRANAMAEGSMNVALQRISTETGVPLENVRNQHKRHPQTGAGGLLVANVLANETKKAPAVFLKQHADGKRWLAIARDNKVSVDKLNDRLERFENALKK